MSNLLQDEEAKNKENPVRYLVSFLVIIAFAWYICGVILASWYSIKCPLEDGISEFYSGVITTIGTVFSTNLGAVIGFSTSNVNSVFKETNAWKLQKVFQQPTPSKIQILACYVYVVSLVLAAIIWGYFGFEEKEGLDSIIPILTKSLLGVIVGALAVSLNVNVPAAQPNTSETSKPEPEESDNPNI